MPKATSSTAKLHRGLGTHAQALARRLSDEDAHANYRRDVLGLPGPVDVWLHASTAGSAGGGGALRADEVRCAVQMQRTEAPDDGSGFGDPDVYTLYLTVRGREARASPRLALQTYCGWPDSLDAPEWTRRRAGHVMHFRQRKTSVTRLVREALWGDAGATEALQSVKGA
ncbi:hypothetical protein B0H21DRAFT_67762 [Amylocystis lapponica]|nr:hypothetical protein B0H21DRAFT_67762 [Amylocystis lapponica]